MADALIADSSPTTCSHSSSSILNREQLRQCRLRVGGEVEGGRGGRDYVLLHVSVRVHALWASGEEGRGAALGKFTVRKTLDNSRRGTVR